MVYVGSRFDQSPGYFTLAFSGCEDKCSAPVFGDKDNPCSALQQHLKYLCVSRNCSSMQSRALI